MMWPFYGWGFGGLGGFWWIMQIVMIIFWGLIVWGIVMLVRRGRAGCCTTSDSRSESAIDILKRRYALGEIGKDEFEEKKKALS